LYAKIYVKVSILSAVNRAREAGQMPLFCQSSLHHASSESKEYVKRG